MLKSANLAVTMAYLKIDCLGRQNHSFRTGAEETPALELNSS